MNETTNNEAPDIELVQQLESEEGYRAEPYVDSTGHETDGFGDNLEVHPGDQQADATQSGAEQVLLRNVEQIEGQLFAALPWVEDLDEVRRDALVDMAFNMGVSELLQFRNTLECLRMGDWNGAAANAQLSRWYVQTGQRAHRVVRELQTGQRAAPETSPS